MGHCKLRVVSQEAASNIRLSIKRKEHFLPSPLGCSPQSPCLIRHYIHHFTLIHELSLMLTNTDSFLSTLVHIYPLTLKDPYLVEHVMCCHQVAAIEVLTTASTTRAQAMSLEFMMLGLSEAGSGWQRLTDTEQRLKTGRVGSCFIAGQGVRYVVSTACPASTCLTSSTLTATWCPPCLQALIDCWSMSDVMASPTFPTLSVVFAGFLQWETSGQASWRCLKLILLVHDRV